jgi:hypothetical protein
VGLSTKKTTTKTNEKTHQDSTVTPTNPEWVTDSVRDFTDRINAFGDLDPYAMVAGPSALQQQAFARAGELGGWQSALQQAIAAAGGAAGGGPNLAGFTGYTPAQGQAQGYTAPKLGPAAQASATMADYRGYDAPRLGAAQGYAASQVSPAQIAALERAGAERGSQYMGDYLNPYLSQVVDTTLADFDENAGTLRAQQAAGAARNNAFSGSRYGIQEAATEGELARARAAAGAQLRSQAFNTAAGYGMQDADRFTNVSLANSQQANTRNTAQAGLNQQAGIRNADAVDAASQFGATANNQYGLAQAGFDENARQFTSNAYNTASGQNAGLGTQTSLANAAGLRDYGLAQAGFDENAGARTVDAANQYGLANLGYSNDAAKWNAASGLQNNQFNAGQMDNSVLRQLQAAGLLGTLGNSLASNQQADLGMLASLGDIQRQIAQAQLLAPALQLETMGKLHAQNNYGLFQGQNSVTDGTMEGTSVQTTNPGIGNVLAGLAQTGLSAWAGGGFGGLGGLLKTGGGGFVPGGLGVGAA